MEIITKETNKTSMFRLLAMGDAFRYDDQVYIKCGIGEVGTNAVNLHNGAPQQMRLDYPVEPLNAVCAINYEKGDEEVW